MALAALFLAYSAFAADGERGGNCSSDRVTQGCGTYSWSDGSKYVGNFKDGYFDGHGVLTYADGSKFEADFQKGTARGVATFTAPDGTRMSGQFHNVGTDNSSPHSPPPHPFWRNVFGGAATVLLTVIVDQDGSIADVQLDAPTGFPSYERAAIGAVRQWKYLPATIEGKAVKIPHHIEMKFPDPTLPP